MRYRLPMDWFQRVGEEVERRWLETDRDDEAFPAIAADVLAALPASEGFDREAFLDRELAPFGPARRERAPLGAFGQPGTTQYFGREMVIEVYHWVSSVSGVHDHPFRGVFTILEGHSVHAAYRWSEDPESPRGRCRTGTLSLDELEVLEAGDTRLFSKARHPLIHCLIHVPVGSLSMVIRTARSYEYWRYHPPSLATVWDEPDQVVSRQLALLEALRLAGDPRAGERLGTFLASADLDTGFRALAPIWFAADDGGRDRLLAPLRARHGERANRLRAALARVVREQQIDLITSQLPAPEDRLVAIALRTAETREQVIRVVGAKIEDPVARLHRFIDELGAAVTGDETSAGAAHVLVDGGGREGVLLHVEKAFGASTVSTQRGQIERFCTESIFAALAG